MVIASRLTPVLAVFLVLSCTAAAPVVKDLGTPVKCMTIWGRLLVRDPVSGRPVLYAGTYTGAGYARLIRYDYSENATEYFTLEGTKGAYGLCEGPDGTIYIGTVQPGKIFSFDPRTKRVTDLGGAAGESFVWTLHLGPDGRIYGATYPNAKIVAYDPKDGKIHDLGRFSATEQYCRDLAVADNGRIFAGIGSHADIVAYDPSTGERKSILPERYKNNSFAYTMDSEDDLVYAFLHFDQIVLIFDADTYRLLMEVRNPVQGQGVYIHRQMAGGPILITGFPGGYKRFNRTTLSLDPYDTPSYSNYDPESGVAYMANSQTFSAYNVTGGSYLSRVDVAKDGEGMDIFSLGTGPDGCIYGGTYNLLHLFRYDPQTSSLEDLGQPIPGASGEFYSFLSHEGKLYMASYTYALLSVYDPSRPWEPGTSNASNPRKIGPVGDEQYRPPAMVAAADGRIYIGSIPAYGKMGGALSSYDPETDEFQVHRNIIPNQSIVSLTTSPDGRLIYGGSSIHGGGGTSPVESEAHLFAWDVEEGRLTMDIVPVRGASAIQSLATAPDGRIYGCAGSTLFVYDSHRGGLIYKGSAREGSITHMRTMGDGLIYGISSSALFRMKPLSQGEESVGFERLGPGGTDFAFGGDGKLYFASGTDLYFLDGLPSIEPPKEDLWIYGDEFSPGWSLDVSGAQVDPSSQEAVASGRCQRISFDRFCTLKYSSPDPWNITLWGYHDLAFFINPGQAALTEIVVSKIGSGNTKTLSLVKAYNLSLPQDSWTEVRVPVTDLGWDFGSRLDSLKLTFLGSGSFYLDSLRLEVREPLIFLLLLPLVILLTGHGRALNAPSE